MKLKSKGVTHCLYVGYAPVYAALLGEANKVGWKPVFFGDYVSVDPRAFMAGDLADGQYHIWAWGLRSEGGPGRELLERLFKEAGADKLLAVELMPSIWNPLMLLTEALQKCGKDLTREKLIDTIESIGEYDTGGLGTIGFGPNKPQRHPSTTVSSRADAKNKTFKAVTDWREPSMVWGKR